MSQRGRWGLMFDPRWYATSPLGCHNRLDPRVTSPRRAWPWWSSGGAPTASAAQADDWPGLAWPHPGAAPSFLRRW